MLIAINNNIIDTKNIVSVNEIKFLRWIPSEDIGDIIIDGYFDKEVESKAKFARFKIVFFNQKDIKILVELKTTPLKRLKDMRDGIIDAWKKDQSKIPQFNL